MGAPPQRSDRFEGGSWPRWARIAGNLAFFGIVIAISIFCRGRRIEWGILFGVGAAISGAIFRRGYRKPWFWPALVFILAIHTAVAASFHLPVEAGAAGVTFTFVLAFDTALDCLFLWWMGWLFDPRDTPKTAAERVAEFVIYGFVIVAIGLVGSVIWAIRHANQQAALLAKVVVERSSSNSTDYLEDCFDADERHRHRDWASIPAAQPTVRVYDPISDLGTFIVDTGQARLVRITTLRGRPLYAREAARVAKCLEPDSAK